MGYAWQLVLRHVQRSSPERRWKFEERSRSHIKTISELQMMEVYYVYLLRSIPNPDQTYIGFTEDLNARFTARNRGQSPHTSKFKPWELITYLAFNNKSKALAFEKYLKSHSGKAFANKRLW
jgi:predicted GIY-YIG superfamily endonuclease